MSADEGFLARWSRRKRGAAAMAPEKTPSPPAEDNARRATPTAVDSMAEPAPPADLASLPPIDSIGPGSDIKVFLMPGVPAELMQAALRRAWAADPAIRDFIGLAENSWDFTASGGVPGFGSVTAEEVERLLRRLTGEPEKAEDANPAPEDQIAAACEVIAPSATPDADRAQLAPRNEAAPRPSRPTPRHRRHGGALPE